MRPSLNHLIRPLQQRGRDRQPEGLVFGGLLDRKLAHLCASSAARVRWAKTSESS